MKQHKCARCGRGDTPAPNALCHMCQLMAQRQRRPNPSRAIDETCFYCKRPYGWVTDHVIPVNRGGDEREENKVPACETCNYAKSDQIPSEWCPDNQEAVALEAKLREAIHVFARVRYGDRGPKQLGHWTAEQHRDAALIVCKMMTDTRALLQAVYYSFKVGGIEAKSAERVAKALERLELKLDTAWYRDLGQAQSSPYFKRPRKLEGA
jgi:hypothetical protein